MPADPTDHSLLRIAANLIRGAYLPQTFRLSASAVERLEDSHRRAGMRIKDEYDRLRTEQDQLRAEYDALLVAHTGMDSAAWEQEGEEHAAFRRKEDRGGGYVTCPTCEKTRHVSGSADVDLSPSECPRCALVRERDEARAEVATEHYRAQRELLLSLWREMEGDQEGHPPGNHLLEDGLVTASRRRDEHIAMLEAEVATLWQEVERLRGLLDQHGHVECRGCGATVPPPFAAGDLCTGCFHVAEALGEVSDAD